MDARNPRLVLDADIAAVVDLAYEEPPAQLPRQLIYCRFPLLDGVGNEPAHLRLAMDAVLRLLVAHTPTLVACSAGMNRSPIIVAVALAMIRNEPADQVLQQLVESRPHDISSGLWDDVLKAAGMLRRIPTILPYATILAICREYDPRAAEVARQIAALVTAHLPRATVEHVGSTSVPGCAGKGIVDLMIPVADGDLDAVKEVLDRLGFQRQTNRDPFPEDRPMRVGAVIHDGDKFLLHVHVIPGASPEVQEMLRFRDRLRADPELVAAYVARKRRIIASGVTDSLEYCYAKAEYVRVTLEAMGR